MSLFCHHIIINTTLNCSISKWKKKWYTAEIHVSRKCTLKDHFFETFLILCRIKNKTYISQQLTTLYKLRWWWMWYIVLKIKTNFESTLKKTKVLKNHWILNISLTYGYTCMQSICVMLKMFVISARIVEILHVHFSFLSGGWYWGYMYMHRRTWNKIWISWWTKTNFSLRTGKSGYMHDE